MNPRRSLSQAALLLIALSFLGCDGPPTVRLAVALNGPVPPRDFDMLLIEATASKTTSGQYCEPVSRVFLPQSPSELPLMIDIERGDEYGEYLVFAVRAYLSEGEDRDEVFRHQRRVRWPSEGLREERVAISATCYGLDCDDPATQCGDERSCDDMVSEPGIFDTDAAETYTIDEVSCFREVVDAGGT